MAWFYLFIASFGEIFGMTFINLYLQKRRFIWLFFLVVSFSLGFFFLALAIKDISLGVAYAIWSGVGATGSVLMGILFFKESASTKRMLFLSCIIIGVVGLRIVG
ncbi:MAG TPA: multidrug efflux SMR transporter [Candidatus Pseudogracilibacillus intestinigallinarum]|uniref:Multidrug efflux SMR transporter n=1 Tax=Candidatus Pseudogracilibacillus intestinigallinarum TaxID=2838742 RepID=A0A9D1PMF7_9BACI|nr:multidrug efflux SMR transporter [Candidatus Pseudogracilibacillus intestinigallinarum]